MIGNKKCFHVRVVDFSPTILYKTAFVVIFNKRRSSSVCVSVRAYIYIYTHTAEAELCYITPRMEQYFLSF
jgi:hypothetical protein